MIISCLDDFGQNEFAKKVKDVTIIDDSLDLNEFIEAVKKANKEYKYVFVSPEKRQILRDNNIRYYAAYEKTTSLDDEINHIRLNSGQKIFH